MDLLDLIRNKEQSKRLAELMRISAKKILGVVLAMAVLLISSHGLAHEQSRGDQTSGAEQKSLLTVPDLADIIPLAAELSGRLTAFNNRLKSGPDISVIEKKYDEIDAHLKAPADRLQRLKDLKGYKYNKLVELRKVTEYENKLFEETSKPLSHAIRKLGAWRKEWLAEKKRWNEWQSSLLREGAFDQLTSTFAKANATIDTALNLILPQLEAMLTLQQKAGNIQAKLIALANELEGLIVEERRGTLLSASPPMFSSQYFSQVRSIELWYTVQRGLHEISWPGSRLFARQGWIVFLQGFLALVVMIAVYRHRKALSASKHWRFIAARPFSAGLFLGTMATLLIYELEGTPAIWKLANAIVGGISFARLI